MRIGRIEIVLPNLEVRASDGSDFAEELFAPPPKKGLGGPYMRPGNWMAAAKFMNPESHKRRMYGLVKKWKGRVVMKQERKKDGVKRRASEQKRLQINPRLRLKVTASLEAREIMEIARTHATAAMERLATIVNDPNSPEGVAIAASAVILDRAYGKAQQTNTNVNVDANGKTEEINGTELAKRVDDALKQVEKLANGNRKAPKSKPELIDLRVHHRHTDGGKRQH